ncbi:MAG: hypothetical protein GY811_28830 [Myxococcales bacterium]|nr:hypothetical protein [Myxococcales bacterium]
MSTSILILSPLAEERTKKAAAACEARAQGIGLAVPQIDVLAEHPSPEDLEGLFDEGEEPEEDPDEEGDAILQERLAAVESVIRLESENALASDPVFVECVRFLLRRVGDAVVQFPEGIAEVDIAQAMISSLDGIEDFDEREEARRMHARLLQIKYRMLAKRWNTGDEQWAPRALANLDVEQHEKSNRLKFPAGFRAYLAIVGVGPGPTQLGIVALDEMDKPKTYAKTAGRAKLGKTVVVGRVEAEHEHILACDGDFAGTIWAVVEGTLSPGPISPGFLEYIETWIGAGEPDAVLCANCEQPLEIKDLEREFCQGCGTRRIAATELSEANQAFQALAQGLLGKLLETELLELEDPLLLAPLIVALTEYMAEKGHKWKSPDRAAASIAGWLLHRDEVAELHGSNSDVARAFATVAGG